MSDSDAEAKREIGRKLLKKFMKRKKAGASLTPAAPTLTTSQEPKQLEPTKESSSLPYPLSDDGEEFLEIQPRGREPRSRAASGKPETLVRIATCPAPCDLTLPSVAYLSSSK